MFDAILERDVYDFRARCVQTRGWMQVPINGLESADGATAADRQRQGSAGGRTHRLPVRAQTDGADVGAVPC